MTAMPDATEPDVYALAMLDALAEGDDDTADALLAEADGGEGDGGDDQSDGGDTGPDDVPPDAADATAGDLLKSLPPRVAAAVRLHQQADDAGRAELVRLAADDPEGYERLIDDAVADMLFTKAEQWDESKHPRDHGKFSSKPGAGGGAAARTLPAVPRPAGSGLTRMAADTYQTVILVTADGRELLYVGRPQIDPASPPRVVGIRATEPRPLPAGHEWTPAAPESDE